MSNLDGNAPPWRQRLGRKMVKLESYWTRRIALTLALLAAIATVWFGMRTHGSLLLLRSAYQVGMPQSSSIRGWMTLRYVAKTYRTPEEVLLARLGLPSDTSPDASLKSLADRDRVSPMHYVQRVQQSIAGWVISGPSSEGPTSSGWLDRLGDDFLSALLKYGYPALALTLLLGAIGLPVPSGLAAAIAGSLSASGRMNWVMAITVGTTASVAGDLIAYGLGRTFGAGIIERHGHWIGYTSGRQVRAQAILARWGAATVFVTRTFVSSLSSIVGVVAGISRYRLAGFLTIVVVGRLISISAYVGLGFGVGSSFDAATGFLANLTGVVLSLFVLAGATLVASGQAHQLFAQRIPVHPL